MNSSVSSCVVSKEMMSVTSESTRRLVGPDVAEKPWFHQKLSKNKANDLLQLDGQYLVRLGRDRADGALKFILSLRWNGTHLHIRIRRRNGLYSADGAQFQTIQEMLDFHKNKQKTVSRKTGAMLYEAVIRRSPKNSPKLLVPMIFQLFGVGLFAFALYLSAIFKSKQ
ncbi:hypothetical protein QR680_004917 [Steinernema hermaphroditum]|uniref:SH2 domain-containing protein n=1 Tax=Steinernema hermaphroditum TaxID=289476 RepID=A0AA39HSG4_9BILA|nr:hypothetical protein QR680_004917 [Steinernema hermaphroditum]